MLDEDEDEEDDDEPLDGTMCCDAGSRNAFFLLEVRFLKRAGGKS